MRIAIIVSQFNTEVTGGLLKGALEVLAENNVAFDRGHDLYSSPGAFELPLLAQKAAESSRYDGVVCLGCVIKGDTAHFEFISLGTSIGLMQAMLKTEKPISFGVLTAYTDEQAVLRSSPNHENKGREAALAVIQALKTISKIQK